MFYNYPNFNTASTLHENDKGDDIMIALRRILCRRKAAWYVVMDLFLARVVVMGPYDSHEEAQGSLLPRITKRIPWLFRVEYHNGLCWVVW